MGTRKSVAIVALAVLVVLAGCGALGGNNAGASGGDGGGDSALAGGGKGGADVARSQSGGDGSDGGGSQGGADAETGVDALSGGAGPDGRAIIRTGTVGLQVEQFDPARADVVSTAQDHGGYVAGSDQTVHSRGNRTWTTGHVVLRIPSENFSAVFDDAKSLGEVQRASSDTRDVTDQLVDLRARLSNLRAQRERLRGLYNSTNDTSEILEVAERLSAVQSDIERLEAKQRSLRQRVAYSTITVELAEPRPEPEMRETQAFHETGLIQALLASMNGVVVTFRTLAVGLAYALPYVVVFGAPLAAVGVYLRRRR